MSASSEAIVSSMNARALALAELLAADPQGSRILVEPLACGTRVIDCGCAVRGGFEAGRVLAEACMGGLGSVTFAPLSLDGRWLPGVTVRTDNPMLACLASQYAGWRLDRDGWFAMASGPGRALVRAEPLFDKLTFEEQSDVAVLCLETRELPPTGVAEYIAMRAGVEPADVTLLVAPTASVAGAVQVASRVVETALHKLFELGFEAERVLSGFGTCPVPPVARTDLEAIGRTNDAVLYGGQVQLTVDADDGELEALVPQLPASASPDHGEPFSVVLEGAGYDFYKIDPLLFSPAEITLTSVRSGRSFCSGHIALDVLARSFQL